MENATPMWDFMSPEDNKALIDKFIAKSNKVIYSWSTGNASTNEKDAVVSFLVQLGAVQIAVHSGSSHIESERQVSIQFEDKLLLETKHGVSSAAEPQQVKKEDIGSREQSVTSPSASQANSSKDAPIKYDDDGDNENYSAWLSERDDDDDDDDDDTQLPVTAKEDDGSATQQPREEHSCSDCHAILHSTWELDLHKVKDCSKAKDPIKYVYNCDQCEKSFKQKLRLILHLRKDHKMTPNDVIEKHLELESTKIKKGLKNGSSKKESHRRQGLRKSRGGKKKQNMAGRNKRGIGSVQKVKRTKNDKAVVPLHFKKLYVRLEKIKHDDVNEFSSTRMNVRPRETAVFSNVGIAPKKCTSDDHQNLEALAANSHCKGRTIEVVGEGNMVMAGKPEHKDNERLTVLPETEFSEARLQEENSHSLANPQSNDNQGFANGNVEGHEDAPSPANMNMESEVLTDVIVADSSEVRLEPREVIEKGTKVDDQNTYSTVNKKSESQESVFRCLLCDMEFEKTSQRYKHMYDCHKETNQVFTCSTCDKTFFSKSLYTTHVETHMDKNKRKIYRCKECNKSFLWKASYDIHMDWHAQRFKCETCGKVLTTQKVLDRHVKSVHTKEMKFPCDLCDKVFATANYLKLHVEDHNQGRKYKCEECGGMFLRPHHLNTHKELVHSGTCKCLCELCGATFKTPQTLKQHTDTVHTNVYKHSCDVCGKKFKRSSTLNVHKKVHSNDPMVKRFPCTLCDKRFRDKCQLKIHMNWHNNVRSHMCDLCGKSFLTKGNLTKHMYTHQEKKPHECEICSRGFADLPGLRKHMEVNHKVTLKKLVTKATLKANKLVKGDHLVKKSAAGPPSPSVSESADTDVGPVHHQEHLTKDNVHQVPEASMYQLPEASVSESVGQLLMSMMNM